MILPITLFLLYGASAWAMLRSVNKPRLEPLAWALCLASIVGHSDAIAHVMRINGSFSIGIFEAISLLAKPGQHFRVGEHIGRSLGLSENVH